MHVFSRTDFYIPGFNMSYSCINVCTNNSFIEVIVGSISITSFTLHIQCRLDCLSLDCSSFFVFRADVLNSMSFLCSAQNSIEVRMDVCACDFQAIICFLSAAVVLYSFVLFCDLICILTQPSEKKSLYPELSGNSR